MAFKVSPERGSNPRPAAYKAAALPTELSGHIFTCCYMYFEETVGFEPTDV